MNDPYNSPHYAPTPHSMHAGGRRRRYRDAGSSSRAVVIAALLTWAIVASCFAIWFYTRPIVVAPHGGGGGIGGLSTEYAGGPPAEGAASAGGLSAAAIAGFGGGPSDVAARRSHITELATREDAQQKWTQCFVDNLDPSADIELTSLTLDPQRVVLGKPLTAYFEAALHNGTIASGSMLQVTLFRQRVRIKEFSIDVCKMSASQSGIACPIEAPQVLSGSVTEVIPSYAFVGDYTLQARLHDADRKPLSCVQVDMEITRG